MHDGPNFPSIFFQSPSIPNLLSKFQRPIQNLKPSTMNNSITKLKHILYFGFILTIMGCQNTTGDKKLAANDSTIINIGSILNQPKPQSPAILDGGPEMDTITTIKFDELAISIYRLMVWDKEKKLNEVQKDTVYITCDVAETAIGQKIEILTSQLTNLKIEQRYETSVSISNEGPHCDLTDWKHYQSEWLTLKSAGQHTYQIADYNESEKEKFPEIDISELKEQVRTQCGEEWFELVKTIQKPTEYPSWVGISKVYIKLTGELNGQQITKLIILEETMGG